MLALYLGRIGIWKCWFFGIRGKTREPGKYPRIKARTNNKLVHRNCDLYYTLILRVKIQIYYELGYIALMAVPKHLSFYA